MYECSNTIHNTTKAAGNGCPSFLVIGCGNMLRGDDGLGPQVAQTVEAWRIPGVAAVAVHQLTPELAPTLTQYDRAIFVDACYITTTDASAGGSVRVEIIKPALHHAVHTHIAAPDEVLALALALYGHCPRSWLVSIPAQRFDFGAPMSTAAAYRRTVALLMIRSIIHIHQGRHTLVQGRTPAPTTFDIA